MTNPETNNALWPTFWLSDVRQRRDVIDPPKIHYSEGRVSFPNPGLVFDQFHYDLEIEMKKVGDIYLEVLPELDMAIDCIDKSKPGALYLERYCWTKQLAAASRYSVPPLEFFLSKNEAMTTAFASEGMVIIKPNVPACENRCIYIAALDDIVSGVVALVGDGRVDVELNGICNEGRVVSVKVESPGVQPKKGSCVSLYRRPNGTYWI